MEITGEPTDGFPLASITGSRRSVIMALYEANQLNDETLPPEKMETFLTKPYAEWSPDMRARLSPYGASFII